MIIVYTVKLRMRKSEEEFLRRIRFDITTERVTQLHKDTDTLLDEIDKHLSKSGFVNGCVDKRELDDFCMETFGVTVEDYLFPKESQITDHMNEQVEKEMNLVEIIVLHMGADDTTKVNVETLGQNNGKIIVHAVSDEEPNERRVILPSKGTTLGDLNQSTGEKRFKPPDGATVPSAFSPCTPVEDLRVVLQKRRALSH